MADKPRQHVLIQDEGKRIVAGWASVEVKDLQGDIVPVNVLERAMYDFMSHGGIIMYGHQNMPVGKVVRWEIKKHPETGKLGLWIEVELYRDSQVADAVWNAIKDGALLGFSISGVGQEEKQKQIEIDGRRDVADIITQLELSEISLVESPANPLARIEYVNYVAKGENSQCVSQGVKMGLKDAEDICKWVESAFKQYGFRSEVEMLEWIANVLSEKKVSKQGEGAITTETPNVANPVYGERATPQMPMDRIVDVDTDEDVYVPKKPKKEPEGKDERLEYVKQLVAELREILRVFREYAGQDGS